MPADRPVADGPRPTGTRSPVTDQPNSRTTARSRSSCPSTTATTPSLPVDANDFFNSLLEEGMGLAGPLTDWRITVSIAPAQCRAARALLNWSQGDLVRHSG